MIKSLIKLIIVLCFVFSSLTAHAEVQCDSDLNGYVDIACGGTNAGTATTARTALGLKIGTNIQAYDAELAALAGLTIAADKLILFTGSGTASTTGISAYMRTVIDDANEAAFKATVNLEAGTDFYAIAAADAAFEAELNDSAGLLAALSDETGTGAAVFSISPTLVTPVLGTITSGVGTALTALNGENIQDDTIDDDSIDWGDVTSTDLTFDADTVPTTAVYSGTTSLEETTAANDSGASIVGVYDEFDNSDSTNVQDVLDDLDAAIVAAGGGDITAVGPGFATGAAFSDGVVSTGTTMFVWEGTTDNTYELSIISPSADPTADINITLPSATGTLLTADGVGTSLTALNGENIQDATIDDDSIDFTDVTLADLTFDVGNVDVTEYGYLNGVTSAIQDQFTGKQAAEATLTDIADGTIAENLVNTANPWADNEVADALTVTAEAGSTWNVADSVTALSVYTGTTSLDETTAADDSGAYIIGVFDEFTWSDSVTVQGVLNDLDDAIVAGGGDVTAVGDCASGGCLDGTSDGGTEILFYDAQGATTLAVGDNVGAVALTLPIATGTLITSGEADTAYEAELNDSAGLLAALDDETGTGVAMFNISPTTTGTMIAENIDGSGTISGNLFTPDAADSADFGTVDLEFSDGYFADGSILYFGDDQDVTLTHTADTGLAVNLNFYAATYGSDGSVSDTELKYVDFTSSGQTQLDAIPDTAFASLTSGGTYTSFSGSADDDTINELFAAINTNWPAVANENTIEGYIFDTDAEDISGEWVLPDDVPFSFGGTAATSHEMEMQWVAANSRLEFQKTDDAWVFAFDFVNSAFLVAAVASPESGLYDSGATGTARTDEYCAGYGGNITDPTEDAVISDMTLHAMNVSKITWLEWDGSDEAAVLGDSETGEDLKFDFETATDNQVAISSNSGVTEIYTTIPISAGVKSVVDANPADGEIDAYCYGGVFFASGTGTAVLPAVAVGMQVTVENHTADDVYIDPDGTEVIRLNGVALTAGYRIIGTDLGDGCVLTYYSAGVWSAFCSGYSDAGS